jgi:hypothetical protein
VAPGPGPLNVFVSEDPDATWARIGDHLLHDARSYAQWQIDAGLDSAALARRRCNPPSPAPERGAYFGAKSYVTSSMSVSRCTPSNPTV